GVALNTGAKDIKRENVKLKEKVDAGAKFALTQIFFTWDIWESFWDEFGSDPPIPVLFGVWPMTSFRLALRIHHEIPEISVPDQLLKKLENAGSSAREVGWEIARQLFDESKKYMNGAYLVAPYKRGESILQLLD
ncbi:MAG: methylenetetrahydrofolate reductase, partial [bacterium]